MFEGMDPYVVLGIFALALLATSLVGAYLPHVKDLDSRRTHLLVSLSAGIFVGILFFTILPDTMDEAHHALHEGAGHEVFLHTCMFILAGFLAVLAVDVLLKHFHVGSCPCEDEHHEPHIHDLTSMTAFIGLAIHAAVDGMLLAVAVWAGGELGIGVLIGLAIHKFVELFSLSSTFGLTDRSRRENMRYLAAFSLITPAVAFLSMPIIDTVSGIEMLIPLAVATGTFMYVGIYSLLREAFHMRQDSLVSFVLVLAGILTMGVISILLGHGHVH